LRESRSTEGGEIDIAGSVLQLEDLRIVPAVASIDMQTRSSLRAALSLMSGKPFSVLDNVEFGPDVAAGDAQFAGNIRLPLKDFVPMEELSFAALGTLTDVSSSTLMDGMALSADTLDVSVDKAGLIISGATTLAAHDAHTELDGQWHKRFGAEFNGRSTVSGHIDLDQGMFDVFKITLPEGMVEGSQSRSSAGKRLRSHCALIFRGSRWRLILWAGDLGRMRRGV